MARTQRGQHSRRGRPPPPSWVRGKRGRMPFVNCGRSICYIDARLLMLKTLKRDFRKLLPILMVCLGLSLGGARLCAAVGDDAQLVSVSIPTGMQIMPRTVFTQTWTFKNTGTNTWTAGQSGYTLNIRSVDSLGAIRVVPNTLSSAYHPSAAINSAHSVAPGAEGSYSMTFVAPEASGSVTDL